MLHRIVQNQVGGIEGGLLSSLCAEERRSWTSLRLTLHTLSTNRTRGRESSEWTMSAIEIFLPDGRTRDSEEILLILVGIEFKV